MLSIRGAAFFVLSEEALPFLTHAFGEALPFLTHAFGEFSVEVAACDDGFICDSHLRELLVGLPLHSTQPSRCDYADRVDRPVGCHQRH